MSASPASSASTLLLVGVGGGRADALPGVRGVFALAFDPLERHRLAVARELDARGVEGAELEDVLPAVVVGALLQVVGERALDRDDHRLRRRRARRRCRRPALPPIAQRRAGAAQVEVTVACRLVEAELLQVGRRRVLGRRSTSSAPTATRPTSPSTDAEVGARRQRLRHLPVAAVLRELARSCRRRSTSTPSTLSRSNLMTALSRRSNVDLFSDGLLDSRRSGTPLLVVALRVQVAAGRRLVADEQLCRRLAVGAP